MNKLKLIENDFGFYIDYIFTDKSNKKCLRISKDDDYFSFSIFSPYEQLVNIQKINIDSSNPLFSPIKKLLEGSTLIEILEEGIDEGKSIIFQDNKHSLDIIFNLTNNPTNVTSISLTNVRLASPDVTFGKGSPAIPDFKNKLNSALLEIKDKLNEKVYD